MGRGFQLQQHQRSPVVPNTLGPLGFGTGRHLPAGMHSHSSFPSCPPPGSSSSLRSLEEDGGLLLTIWPPVWRCCCWWNMAESKDIPLLDQYLLENIIMAGCILGTGSRLGFSTWDEAMGNQWV